MRQNTKHKTQIANRKSPSAFLRIDLRARRVWNDGQELHLTRLEYELLAYLAKQNGKVVTYQELWREVWQSKCRVGAQEKIAVREVAKRLRKKLGDLTEPSLLQNVRGIGFRLLWANGKIG